ncbi:hypothetical protein WDU94_001232 [Cyamophila willieti]
MNSEELLQRAAEERHAIVQKYLKGREEGADIDAWEEPFAIYNTLDRFGFVQDEKNFGQAALSQKALIEHKEIELEMERSKKWSKMVTIWTNPKFGLEKVGSDKLKRRVYKGIPNSCRGVAWALLLNVAEETKNRPTKYEEMLDLAYKYSPDIRQIDLDVNRTYREHIFFRDRYSDKQRELFNVLAAFSVYNLEIGYCQGMSQIAALLLMYLSEQEAFWALAKLVIDPKYSMHGFFIPGFPKLLRYQEHHDKIMAKFLPKLKKHLDKNSVDTGIYTLKWFFQCFLDRIPFKLTLRVWDIYLLEGERIMSAMAYNLLKMHKNQLYKLNMDDILYFIQVKLEKQFEYSEDATIESLQKCLDELRRNKLDYAGKPPAAELPKTKLGIFKPDAHSASLEQKVGRRTEFSSVEKSTQETVITRRDNAVAMATMLSDRNSSIGTDASKYDPSSPTPSSREKSEYSPTPSDKSSRENSPIPREISQFSPAPRDKNSRENSPYRSRSPSVYSTALSERSTDFSSDSEPVTGLSNRTTTYSQGNSDRTTSRETIVSLTQSPTLKKYDSSCRDSSSPVPSSKTSASEKSSRFLSVPDQSSQHSDWIIPNTYQLSTSAKPKNSGHKSSNSASESKNTASEKSSSKESSLYSESSVQSKKTRNSASSDKASRNSANSQAKEFDYGNSGSKCSSDDGNSDINEVRGNSATEKFRNYSQCRNSATNDDLNNGNSASDDFVSATDGEIEGDKCRGNSGNKKLSIRRNNEPEQRRNFNNSYQEEQELMGKRSSGYNEAELDLRNSAAKNSDEFEDVSSIGSISSKNSSREANNYQHYMNDNTSISSSKCPSGPTRPSDEVVSIKCPSTITSPNSPRVSFTNKRSLRSSFRKRQHKKEYKENWNSSHGENISVRGVSFRESPAEDSGYAGSKCSTDGGHSDRSSPRNECENTLLVTHL